MGPVGYIYLGQWNWFFVTVVISVVVYILTFGLAYALFPFVFAFHQYQMARELNENLAASTPRPDGEGSGVQTGGTGPAPRDLTPEATAAACTRMMPGFGELMRMESLKQVPTAILSRQVAVIRKGSLIVNLPGQPKSIRETLEGLKDAGGKTLVAGIFASVPYCIDLIGGPYIESDPAVCQAFRPKSALRS